MHWEYVQLRQYVAGFVDDKWTVTLKLLLV